MMTNLEKIKTFLRDSHGVSIGYNELEFFAVDELDNEQIGYSVDTDNTSLITGQEGDWRAGWLVIGVDGLIGDPIFVDTSSKHLPVLTAFHGEGEWEPYQIADTLESFQRIIMELKMLSVDRSNPVDLEKNPISKKVKEQLLAKFMKGNPNSDIDYWENFLAED